MTTTTRCAICAGEGILVKSSPAYNPRDPYIKWVPAYARLDTYPLSEAVPRSPGAKYCPVCGGSGKR